MSDRTPHIKLQTAVGPCFIHRDAVSAVLPAAAKDGTREPMQCIVMVGDNAVAVRHAPDAVVSMLDWDKPEEPPSDPAEIAGTLLQAFEHMKGTLAPMGAPGTGLGVTPLAHDAPFGPTTPVSELHDMIDDAASIDEAVELARQAKKKTTAKKAA